ncbi:hypothetical protein ABBQ38_005718 [Trebouxia sp. C0009 RCD-2024]
MVSIDAADEGEAISLRYKVAINGDARSGNLVCDEVSGLSPASTASKPSAKNKPRGAGVGHL